MTAITARLSTALADRYQIESRLGEGGMATVYLAEDLTHKRLDGHALLPMVKEFLLRHRRNAMKSASWLLAVVALGACGQDTPMPASGELVFRVRVADLGIQSSTRAEGRSPDDEIELRVRGELFEPPHEVTAGSREQADQRSPIAASGSAFSAFIADDADWIVSNFAKQDREAVQSMLANQQMRTRNREVLARHESYKIVARAAYVTDVTYELLFIRYGDGSGSGFVETYVSEDGRWKRTNALSSDEGFDLMWAAFRTDGVTEAR